MVWWAFIGCGGLGSAEIRRLLDDETRLLADVEARLDSIETLIQPVRHGQGDGDYRYAGTLEASGAWDAGTVRVDGTGTSRQSNAIQFSSVDLLLDGVVIDGTTYDGPLAADLSVTIFSGTVSVAYTVVGEVQAAGRVSGATDQDWAMQASTASGGEPEYSGEVNGRDVARIAR